MPYNDSNRPEGRLGRRAAGGHSLEALTPLQSQGRGDSGEAAGWNVGGGPGSISALLVPRRSGKQGVGTGDISESLAGSRVSPQNVSFRRPLLLLSARSVCWAVIGVHLNPTVSCAPAPDGDTSSFSYCRRRPSAR